MGAMCSDPGHRPELSDLRYAVDTEFDDLNDCDSEIGSEISFVPSITRVPIARDHLRVYRIEKKNQEIFFDLDSVDEVYGVQEKAKSDVTSYNTNRNQCTRTWMCESKQDSYSSQTMYANGQNARLSSHDTRSVCSDQTKKRSSQTESACSERGVYTRPKASGKTKECIKHTLFSRGQCTDEESFSSVCSDRVEVRRRASPHTERCSENSIASPRGYCTDDISFKASIELAEKSESESDSLKFVATQGEARKSIGESMLEEFQTIEKLTIKSSTQKINTIKQNKEKLTSASDTDSTSIRSSVSQAYETDETEQRRDGSFVYPEPKGQKLGGVSNFSDKILDFQQLPEGKLLNCGGKVVNTSETHNQKSHAIAEIGERNTVDEGEEVLIFTTIGIVDPCIKDREKAGDTFRDDRNVVLP
jgi:hypothetical protein